MSYHSYSPRSSNSFQPRPAATGPNSYEYNYRAPSSSASHGSRKSTPLYVRKDLGSLVQTFQRPSGTINPARITLVKPVSSYSWIEAGSKPTILVPALGADIDLQDFDIVTDRNNLRKLLRWADGAQPGKEFRIDLDIAGKTCLFTRREEKDSEYLTRPRGYGHEYEKAATRWPKGSERATGHHRVISINMGGIKILLRFELDACTQAVPSAPSVLVDDLVTALTELRTEPSDSVNASSFNSLDIKRSENRTLVSQSSLIEIKTRSGTLDVDDTAPQLYLSQTPYLYLAKREKGEFKHVESIQLDVDRVEGQVGKLRETLLDILTAVRQQGSGAELCLVYANRKLELYQRKSGTGRAVGPENLSKFANQSEDCK
ncbi:hypothetical protein FRC01_003078 [Tulasnella sp. 417]|nr:hypothetical protein FRC01_003078 [Tulasnella sp. 417]